MRKLIICDKNKKLIDAVNEYLKENGKGIFDSVEVIHGDVIKVHEENPETRIVTASNPQFSPDGGLDAALAKKYEWQPREFSWGDHLFYAVSVNDRRTSSKDVLLRLAVGVLGYSTKFVPILTGVGTGIGGVAVDVFLDILRAVLTNLSSADLSSADLSSADLRFADLRSANLRSADLSSANLSSANLSSAKGDIGIYWDNLDILRSQKSKLIAYKYVTSDMRSPVNGNLEYKLGSTVELTKDRCNYSNTELCAAGLNVATLDWCIRNCNCPNPIYIEVEFSPKDIVSIPFNTDGKFRVRKLKVKRILSDKEIGSHKNRELK